MARINFEETIYKDGRFMDLCIHLGDRFKAIGVCVVAWSLGQAWYLKSPGRSIPMEEWKKAGIPATFIECGLGEVTDSGIRICGADAHFAWLVQCQNGGFAKSLDNSKRVPTGYLQGSQTSSLSSLSSKNKEEILLFADANENEKKSAKGRKEKTGVEAGLHKLYLAHYPRTQGWTPAWKRLRSQLTLGDLDDFRMAILNYRNSPDVRKGFVKLFSTFAGEWRDWIDPRSSGGNLGGETLEEREARIAMSRALVD